MKQEVAGKLRSNDPGMGQQLSVPILDLIRAMLSSRTAPTPNIL